MSTAFLLMAQSDGKAIIPIDDVCRDYLTPTKLVRKISSGGDCTSARSDRGESERKARNRQRRMQDHSERSDTPARDSSASLPAYKVAGETGG